MQNKATLHVCVYYPEHKPMAYKLYGKERVDKQLEETVDYCNECRMLSDLCLFVGMRGEPRNNIPVDGNYEVDFQKSPLEDRNRNIIGVKTQLVYREVTLTAEEFFKPPEDGKRWIDHL